MFWTQCENATALEASSICAEIFLIFLSGFNVISNKKKRSSLWWRHFFQFYVDLQKKIWVLQVFSVLRATYKSEVPWAAAVCDFWQETKTTFFGRQCLLHRPSFQHLIATAPAAAVVFFCCSIYYLSSWHRCTNPNSNSKVLEKKKEYEAKMLSSANFKKHVLRVLIPQPYA